MSAIDQTDDETESRAVALMWRRMDEAIGKILKVKDRIPMSDDQARKLRRVVLRELNDLTELAVILLDAADAITMNELYVQYLEELRTAVVKPPP